MSARTRLEVSDHALVRWMQRTGLADLEPIREQLRQSLSHAAEAAMEIGVSEFLVLADGMVFVVRSGIVVTVIPEDGRHHRARALSQREVQRDA